MKFCFKHDWRMFEAKKEKNYHIRECSKCGKAQNDFGSRKKFWWKAQKNVSKEPNFFNAYDLEPEP